MSQPILTHAHNIYEQQAHNRRMTWVLIAAFVFLVGAIGAGFDIFFNVSPVARIIILPFVILMFGSGIWNFSSELQKDYGKSQKHLQMMMIRMILRWSFILLFGRL